MRITLWCRSFLAGVLVSVALAASAIAFGAGVANAEHGRIGPWPGDGYGYGPYIVAPGPNAAPASSDDATWPPTGPSWPPGGSGGDSGGSATPIVMPHNQPSTTPAATAE
jgi:hypothetical protein